MSRPPSTIERAFQIAREGSCRSVDDIRKTLKAEGFDSIDAYVSGSIVKQLKAEIVKRLAAEKPSS